jgi:hypothetical protein
LDTPLEKTLNAISLFQKPTKLFYAKHLSLTSKLVSNSPFDTNYVEPQSRPINTTIFDQATISQLKAVSSENLNTMAISSSQAPTIPAKPCYSSTNSKENPLTIPDPPPKKTLLIPCKNRSLHHPKLFY